MEGSLPESPEIKWKRTSMRKQHEAREQRKALIRNLVILVIIIAGVFYLARPPVREMPAEAKLLFQGGFGGGLIERVGFTKAGNRIAVLLRMGQNEQKDTVRLAYITLNGGLSVSRVGSVGADFDSDWAWATGEGSSASISFEASPEETIRGPRIEKTDGGISVLIPNKEYEVPREPRLSDDGKRATWAEDDGIYVVDAGSAELFRSKGGGTILKAWAEEADGYPRLLDWTPAPCAFSPADRAVAYYRMVDTIGGQAMGFVFTHLPKFGLWKGLGARWKKHLAYGIAVYDTETGKRTLLFIVPAALRDGSQPLNWQDKLNYAALDWSPDGQWIAFTTDGGARLWIAPAKVQKEEPSTNGHE
jgi:hypothetical protein